MKKYYKIKKEINWRKERGSFIVLKPSTKQLFIFNENVSKIVSRNGVIVSDEHSDRFIQLLINDGIVVEIEKPVGGSLDFSSSEKISAPFNVTIQVTNKCNLKCSHCHRGNFLSYKTLSLDEFKKIVTELRELNVFNINISGGEPTLVPDLKEMIKYSSKIGLKVTMSTNNTLMTEKLAKGLATAGLREVHISLDSSIIKKHDQIRGLKNAYTMMIRNLPFLQKSHIKYMFVTTLTSQSIKDYDKIFDLAFELGGSGHKTNTVIPEGRATLEIAPYYKDNKLFNRYAGVWRKKKNKYNQKMQILAETMFQIQLGKDFIAPKKTPRVLNVGCPAGILTCAIDEFGNLSPCSFFSEVAGNVLEKSFSSIWAESKLLDCLRSKSRSGHCCECFDLEICGGCRARAYGVFREFNAEDSFCYKTFNKALD